MRRWRFAGFIQNFTLVGESPFFFELHGPGFKAFSSKAWGCAGSRLAPRKAQDTPRILDPGTGQDNYLPPLLFGSLPCMVLENKMSSHLTVGFTGRGGLRFSMVFLYFSQRKPWENMHQRRHHRCHHQLRRLRPGLATVTLWKRPVEKRNFQRSPRLASCCGDSWGSPLKGNLMKIKWKNIRDL